MEANFTARQTLGLEAMTRDEVERLHFATLEVLERTGVEVFDQEALGLLRQRGAYVDGTRVRIPAAMVEEAVRRAPGKLVIHDREGKRKLFLERGSFYFGTGSDTPFVLDLDTGEPRKALKKDVAQAATVADALPNIDFVMSLGLASDVPTATSDIHQFQAMIQNTVKPIIFTAHDRRRMQTILKIAEIAAGGARNLREKPNIILYAEPTTPLRHSRDALQKLLLSAEKHVPVIYTPAVMIGASGPVTLAGSLVVANSELLSGLVIHQLKSPGAPFIYGGAACGLDMKTGTVAYGSPEHHSCSACLASMARYYDLPVFATAGCSDAITFDQQAGIEAGYSLLFNALNGSNLIHDVGFLGSGMVASLEMLVACDETIGLVKRLVRGVDFSFEKLSVDTICEVGIGGNYIDQPHTAKYFREELWFPQLLNRNNYYAWLASGKENFADRVKQKTKQILAEYRQGCLSKELEQRINSIVENSF